jgi:hypothetical protein
VERKYKVHAYTGLLHPLTSTYRPASVTSCYQWFGVQNFFNHNRSGLAFASTVIPVFSLLEIHDQDFCSLLDMGPPLRRRRGRSSYVGATIVAPQFQNEYIRAVTTSRSLWTMCTLCHCTILSNIYTRYTGVSSKMTHLRLRLSKNTALHIAAKRKGNRGHFQHALWTLMYVLGSTRYITDVLRLGNVRGSLCTTNYTTLFPSAIKQMLWRFPSCNCVLPMQPFPFKLINIKPPLLRDPKLFLQITPHVKAAHSGS